MRVLSSLDIEALESRLIRDLTGRPDGGLEHAALIVAPTRRLVQHVRRRLVDRVGAVLNVHFHTWRSLARTALEHAFVVPPRLLPPTAIEAIVASLLARLDRTDDAHSAPRAANAPGALVRTLLELREAEVTPRELASAGPRRWLVELYRRFDARMAEIARDGRTDETGLEHAARPHLRHFVASKRIRCVWSWGAYELIGIHASALRELERLTSTTVVVPTALDADAPAFAYARRSVKLLHPTASWDDARETSEHCAERQDAVDAAHESVAPTARRRSWLARLSALFDAGQTLSPWSETATPILELRDAQGAEAEIRAAALRALAITRELPAQGELALDLVAPDEIAIVARSLEPYAPFLESAFEAAGLPFTTSVREPIARDAEVERFTTLLAVLANDLERDALIRLVRLPPAFLRPLIHAADPALWDRWSRTARVFGTAASWRALPTRLELAGNPAATRLVELVDALDSLRDEWHASPDFAASFAFLRRLAHRCVDARRSGDGDGDTRSCVDGLLDRLDTSAPVFSRSGARFGPADLTEFLGRLARDEKLPLEGDDERGVHVLDLQGARGLGYAVVIWIGFHDGLFPRRGRGDPWLGDAARHRLRRTSGRPIAVTTESVDEERLLLAMGLAACRRRLVLSRQRADDDGRTLGRSSALREVARAFLGRADAHALIAGDGERAGSERVPAHPGERAHMLAASPSFGLVPGLDAVVSCAVSSSRDRSDPVRAALDTLGLGTAERLTALDWVEVLEARGDRCGDADGVTGIDGIKGLSLYPTKVERLTRCPLAFFLEHVLGTRPLPDRPRAERIDENTWGNAIHTTLEDLWGELEAAGVVDDPDAAIRLARSRLDAVWTESFRRQVGPSWTRLEDALRLIAAPWRDRLAAAVEEDLRDVVVRPAEETCFETMFHAPIRLAADVEIDMRGRVDRFRSSRGSLFVDDFKTGRQGPKKVAAINVLRGESVQLALYHEIVARQHDVEPHRVHSQLLVVRPSVDELVHPLDWSGELRAGTLETLAVAVRLARSGRFPFRRGDACKWCRFRGTCRRHHGPSEERHEADPALADFRDVTAKITKTPTLQAVRAARAASSGEPSAHGGADAT